MNSLDVKSSLTPIVWTKSEVLGQLQAHLGDKGQDAEVWYSLGLGLMDQGRYQEAAAALHAALTLSPHNIGVEYSYAIALGNLGVIREAVDLLEDVIHRNPGDGWAYFHLASLRYRQGDCGQASQLWEAATRLLDDPMDCLENLAMVRRRLGQTEGERYCWQRAAKQDPTNPIVAHMLAAVGLKPTPPRAEEAYLRCLFDRFAPYFDAVLQTLDYRVPDIVEACLREINGPPAPMLRILDAGCGTGLCGERLRLWSRYLTGVDISPGMLTRARLRNIYDEIVESDLVYFLKRGVSESYDWIVAGDVLCYFGDIKPLIMAAASCLVPGGRIFFTLEKNPSQEEESSLGYRLQSHGRYCHTEKCVEMATIEAGLKLEKLAIKILRNESGEPVEGICVILRKQ